MSTATSPKPATQSPVPPDEQFWVRYSPHHEAPTSIGASIGLHLLIGGGLLLFGMYLANLLLKSDKNLPVEPVRLLEPGGGGGKKTGKGDGPGIGDLDEDVGPVTDTKPKPGKIDKGPKLPSLNPVQADKIKQTFNKSSAIFINNSTSESVKRWASLDEFSRKELSDGLAPGKGRGGAGSGGGKGSGKGKGDGSGTGEGSKVSLTQREKRMLRWHMLFNAENGPQYLAQLRSLGAILAVPVVEQPRPQYKVIRDLRKPAKLLNEDISQIKRIYWIDNQEQSVQDIMAALGLSLRPSRFVAFMPLELERKLYEMERYHVEKVMKRRFVEDNIDETRFRVTRTSTGGYRPVIESVSFK